MVRKTVILLLLGVLQILSGKADARPLVDLTIVEGGTPAPPGYYKLNVDLNRGSGGAFLYLCARWGNDKVPITNIIAVKGKNASAPTGYSRIPVDCNKGAGGEYIYLCYKRNSTQDPIVGLSLISGDESDAKAIREKFPFRLEQDLNEGAKGTYIYLHYQLENHDKFNGQVRPIQVQIRENGKPIRIALYHPANINSPWNTWILSKDTLLMDPSGRPFNIGSDWMIQRDNGPKQYILDVGRIDWDGGNGMPGSERTSGELAWRVRCSNGRLIKGEGAWTY